jgi:hypothetical protein
MLFQDQLRDELNHISIQDRAHQRLDRQVKSNNHTEELKTPISTEVSRAAIRSCCNIIYNEIITLLAAQLPQYKTLLNNQIMRGMLYTVVATSLSEIASTYNLNSPTMTEITNQLKIQGIASITLGGIDITQSVITKFMTQMQTAAYAISGMEDVANTITQKVVNGQS